MQKGSKGKVKTSSLKLTGEADQEPDGALSTGASGPNEARVDGSAGRSGAAAAIEDDDQAEKSPAFVRTVSMSSSPPVGRSSYGIGRAISVLVTFSEPVTVIGTPKLELWVGEEARQAVYDNGTGTSELVFAYLVAEGDEDSDGVSIEADSLLLDEGTIQDAMGNAVLPDHEGLEDDPKHRVDGIRPELAAGKGASVAEDTLMLIFAEPLDGSSVPVAGDFTVKVEGQTRHVTSVVVGGNAVRLGLVSAVETGERVTVSYAADADTEAETQPIRDVAGNEASGFTQQEATNRIGQGKGRAGGALPLRTVRQIETLLAEKAQRTPAQRKVSSRLLDDGSKPSERASAEARADVTDTAVPQGLVTVDIRADVTPAVLARIRALGGTVVSSVPKYRAIRARLPLAALEPLATLEDVQSIRSAERPITNQVLERSVAGRVVVATSKVDTTEGDVAHQADAARTTHSVDGKGIGIGVISDGVEMLADQQATGDLPSRVTILPGQEGGSFPLSCGERSKGTEGTAMLEIVHDLAPAAELFFSTGAGGQAQMAQNIEDLCTAGADVIVDDLAYLGASAFQDDVIAQAISAAAANGCYYFSSAGNGGNKNDDTASVWEGDFAAGPALSLSSAGSGAVYHDFGGGVTGNEITTDSTRPIVLQWADPVGGSANDYDLFLIDADGRVLARSTNTQDGTQDPLEFIRSSCSPDRVGTHLVIVKNAGAADRYLRLSYAREGLAITTAGHTFGHSASEDAIGVGAVDVADAGGADGVFNGTESIETFSSDGPRRIFFKADGTAITPGNFSSTGGRVLQKPDLAAADGVSISAPGFATFHGTSAAAPHAAAIAALMLEAAGGPANVTPAALRTAMTGSALDIEETGVDRDSGAGIVMAPDAVDAVDVAAADRNGAPTVASAPADRTLAPGGVVAIGVAGVFPDPDDDTLTYTVWSSDAGRLSVGVLTGTVFTLTALAPGRMEVTVVATDPEGLSAVLTIRVTVEVGRRDYDGDDDGLIDVGSLAQLDAMRYDLDGNGSVDEPADWSRYHAAFVEGSWDMGCPAGCSGYELTANLDFDTDGDGDVDSGDDYWNGGDGWVPVGDAFDSFTAIFDGEGHTVSNLFIDFPGSNEFYPAGLFGMIRNGVVRDVGLLDVDVTGGSYVGALVGFVSDGEVSDSSVTGSVSGDDYVGGLVGRSGVFFYNDESHSAITGSYSTAQVSGRDNVGGLVGLSTSTGGITAGYATGHVEGTEKVGGLVGFSIGPITTSYATGHVEGTEDVGGLAGDNRDNITASYATGHVEGTENVGGLVGYSGGTITASYATGLIWGDENVGGLVGWAHPTSTRTASYWDMHTSGHAIGPGGRTTTELQAPTDYGGIYRTWNPDLDGDTEADDPWDFGTSAQYPVVVADLDGNGEATWQEFGYQLRAGPALTASTGVGQGVTLTWTAVDTSPWTPAPAVAYTLIRDDGTTVEILAPNLAGLSYTDTAVTAGATYTYQVAALVDGGAATRSALVKVVAGVANQPPRVVVGTMPDRILQVGNTEVLELAGAFSDLDDTLTYAASSSDADVATVSVSGSQATITAVAAGRTTITVTATETGSTNLSVSRSFRVTVWTGTGVDYDTDDDGLIDIFTLAQLDAIRHDPNGDGVPVQSGTAAYTMAFPIAATGMGCPSSGGCTGYELETDLDFDTNADGSVDAGDEYWDNGRGWEPIGQGGYPLYATFEGNGRTIRNLFSRYFSAGLFGGNGGVIRRVGLIDVDVSGGAWVGGLVAENRGEIHSSYVTGRVSGDQWVGGLVGTAYERGRITASFSTARVTGSDRLVGGLVGVNSGAVSTSYATGRVSGGDGVGGLIGGHCGSLTAGYATGTVSGGSDVGGLIGLTDACSDDDTVVTASYWDTATSGLSSSAAGTGQTTSELQEPTGATGLYESWNDGSWDFGTSSQYPALQVNFDTQGAATWQEFGYQLRAAPTLTATATETTTAGQARVDLTWTGVDANHWTPAPDVTYTVTRTEGSAVETLAEDLAELTYTDSPARSGATYTYRVAAVVDGGEAVRGVLVVNTPGNSPPVPVGTLPDRWLHVGDAAGVEVGEAFEDPENDVLTYAVASSATGVATVSLSGTRVTITPVAAGTATITVTATDASGSTESGTQTFTVSVMPSSAIDYDRDDDGLIEITSLQQLDAVRWDTDGDGLWRSLGRFFYPLAYPGVDDRQACGGLTGCVGYELGADLDFDTNGNGRPDKDDEYWGTGRGWEGIGDYGDPFEAIFEGNGRTISNLFVDSFFTKGLFSVTGPSSVIRHVGLIGVAVAGTNDVGGLAGLNSGVIIGSYVTGTVSGTDTEVGGLMGENRGSVVASYAAVEVTGGDDAGGLVGANHGTVTASYATGRAAGDANVGGLVGSNSGTVTASYATGPVSGESDVGGLAGSNSGTVTASYWDTTTSSLATGAAGQGQNTVALQTPSGYSGIYSQWNVDLDGDGTNEDYWHFGTSGQYPALKVNFDGQGQATWPELGHQLREGPTLTAAAGATGVTLNWTAVDTSHWSPAPSVTYTLYRDDGTTLETIAEHLTGLTYTDTDVTAGETYIFQVAALVTGGAATRSAPVSVDVETAPLTVTLELTPNAISENGASATVTARLNRASSEETTITVSTAAVAPAVAADFTLSANKTLTITAGETVSPGTVTITAHNNNVDTPDKTVRVSGTAGNSEGVIGPSAVALTIRDDDAVPELTLSVHPEEIEEAGGTATVKVKVTNHVTFAADQTITLTVEGTADEDTDYTVGSKTLTLIARQSEVTTAVTAINDKDDDDAETILVTATHGSRRVGTPRTIRITDDDSTPVITTGALIPVAENETAVGTLQATDEDDRTEDLEWEITGGEDRSHFTLTGGGSLAFTGAKDYEEPDDSDRDGDYEVTVQVSDRFNAAEVEFTVRLQDVDDTDPTVSSLAISSDPGSDRTYAADDEIQVRVTFSETVEVEGTPWLTLELGGGSRTATYEGGSGRVALVFAYEVAERDSDTDGVGVEADSLTGGTIRDAVDNPAVLDHDGLAADSGHKVDGVRPALVASGGAVVNGTALTLTFDEPLDGSSTPEAGDFTVSGGDQTRTVSRVSVSGSTVVLTLDVGAEHLEAGIQVSYTPGTNRIRDVPGNQAEGLSRESVRNDTPDTTPPEVESMGITSNPGSDQTYAAEDEIEVTVTFSETVEVEETPQLRLRVGNRTRTAGYDSGTGTAALVFGYEVADGDEDTDGVSIEAGRIALNGGTIEDEAENVAELAHEALETQAGHQVDGVRPSFLSAAVDGSSLTVTYGETLDEGSRPAAGDFTMEVGGSGRSVTGVSISGSVVTLTLNPVVEHGDTGVRVSYTVPTGVGANPIRDAVGNEARGLSNRPVTNTTGAQNTAPEITSPSSLDVRENQAAVRQLAARDVDPGDEVTGWTIVGGVDQGHFSISFDTGELSFRESPDYEDPTDVASTDPPSGGGENEYVVTVEVRSGVGARELEAEKTLTVRVTDEQERPGVPEAPTFSGETTDSLTVSWSEPENTGPAITDYDVQYREEGAGRFTDAQHEGPGFSLTLSDLKPGMVYEVQVRARNEEGTGDWSESGEGRTITPLTVEMTSGAEPPVPGPFTVRFSFSEPVTGFFRSDIETGQDPACVDDQNNPVFCDPGIETLETVDDRVFTATVTPWTDRVAHNYTLTLTVPGGRVASIAGGKQNEAPEEPLEVRVAPPGVTEPISSIGLVASGRDGEVKLSWNQPSDNGGSPIIRYEYRYQAVGEEWSEWENVGAGARGVTVVGLINGTEYVFEVRAVNALGKGGAETVMATPELRIAPPPPPRGGGGGGGGGGLLFPPEAPLGLMAMPGDGAVSLEWDPPESDGGTPILRYEYRLKEGRGEFGEWRAIEDSAPDEVNASGYTVGELDNGTVYVFELRAVNLVDEGPESEAVEVVMGLDRAYWSNFLAEDLEAEEAGLEHTPFGGVPRRLRLRFGAGLRFEESELDGEGEVTGTRMGSYGYRYTSHTMGELRLDYDEGESCGLRMTFRGVGAGSYSYRCGGALQGQGSFRLTGLNRVPKITSTGPFEVMENTTTVAQLEAADPDEGDEIAGYGIAGGADGGLFAVDEGTGELRFGEAPDYENPGDVESAEPLSGARDNEYVVVVEVWSGEGERERKGQRAIRVRVSDEEEPPEITSTGPFEVMENTTTVVQLEAVDPDEGDEVTGYGIAGGADGALFAVDEGTGELRFGEAPDYENPGDVESAEPQSGAGDNEYIVVVEVWSGEGERERKGQRAIRVRVSDEEEPPEITSVGPIEVVENQTMVVQLEAVDPDEGDEVTGYGIAGGADGALFAVDEETGELMFGEAPDYENPGDVESAEPESGAGDNEYIVVVEVWSGEGERERRGSRAIRVRVADEEEPPEITSTGLFEVAENQTRVGQLEAADPDEGDEVTGYGIAGGADGALFAVDEGTGELRFGEAPDYENPGDVESAEPESGAGDNEYIVVVEVWSGEGERERKGSRAIRVRVADEEEPPEAPGAPVVEAEGSDSLKVSWTEPENRGPEIVDYDVRYREEGEEGYSDGGHEGTGLMVRLSGLKEGTVYEVQVRAVNEEGMSEWSEPGEGRTGMEEADPDDPSDFTGEELEGRRLTLRLEGEEGAAGSLELRFGEGNRFEQAESAGTYTYEWTGPGMGTLGLDYDDGSSCEVSLTFTGTGVGTFSYDCGDGNPAEGSFRLTTGSLFIPVILSSAGRNNSFFTSEMTLTNRGEQDVSLDYTYTAERGGGSGTASEVLPAGRQRVKSNALGYLIGLGVPIPESGNRIGTLRVEVPLGSEVEAVVRTTTVVPDGRAGLAYLGVAEEEGFTEAVYLCGLRQNSRDRSNLALQNMGAPEEGAITLRATVYSGEASDSSPRVLEDITLEPGGFHQYSPVLGSVANGYVKVERVEGEAPFYAYGVINDQANSDGSFIFPVTASSLEGTMGQTLPVIVETSEFRSELTVTNFSEEPRALNFRFVSEQIKGDNKTASFSMTLEAGQQEIVAEVVEALRRQGVAGMGSTRGFYAGPLFVEAGDGDMSGIVVGARTGSEGGGGSYSVFYNAVPDGKAFAKEAWVEGLQQNEENRSNLALVNTGEVDGSRSVFHLEIYDGETGMLVQTVVTRPVPARGWHQINGILGSYAPDSRQGYIRIQKVSGENPFLAYGVVNDGGAPGERSGDGAYVPARE